jgi:4-diphosphocytidyl-2-C-methyl-D-erythritol kinase
VTALPVAVAVDAPAKINLALHVIGRRDDGYHLLESLCVFTQFGDRLSVEISERDGFHVDGPGAAGVPGDGSNLVLRARDALRQRLAHGVSPVSIALEKNLPAASGLGGGSSDAAATLVALARLWRVSADVGALREVGIGLGADVPMCLERRPLVARGVGDLVEPLPHFPALSIVLANPDVAVSTPAVFRALARSNQPPLPALPPLASATAVAEWLGQTRNDLTDAALSLAPGIADVLKALDRQGALVSRMSGSGATCFGIFRDMTSAREAAASIQAQQPGWFVVATLATGTGD